MKDADEKMKGWQWYGKKGMEGNLIRRKKGNEREGNGRKRKIGNERV